MRSPLFTVFLGPSLSLCHIPQDLPRTIIQVSVGYDTVTALEQGGQVWCWGGDAYRSCCACYSIPKVAPLPIKVMTCRRGPGTNGPQYQSGYLDDAVKIATYSKSCTIRRGGDQRRGKDQGHGLERFAEDAYCSRMLYDYTHVLC